MKKNFEYLFMVPKLSKNVHFLMHFLIFAALSEKSKSIKAIFIYASERSCYALSENGIIFYDMAYCFGDIRIWSQKILLNFCWASIFFDILITNISWAVAQTPIGHTIFWKRTFRYIHVNTLNRFRFLAEVSSKLQKMQFFGQFRGHNSGRKNEN